MSAPEVPPAAPGSPPSRFDAALLRFGRFADRTKLLTVGGWGLFGVSTVLGAALAVPPVGGPAAVSVIPAVGPPAPLPNDSAEPLPLPHRTAQLDRRWPAVPETFDPPPADWADAPPPVRPPRLEPITEPDDAPWDAALADLPPAAREDLAAVRERFGSVTDSLPRFPAAEPFAPALPAAPVSRRAGGDPDLAGLRHAAAVCRHNLANAYTPGYRRLEAVCEAKPDLGGAAPAGVRVAHESPAAGGGSNVDVPAELARLAAVERLLSVLDAGPSRVAARP